MSIVTPGGLLNRPPKRRTALTPVSIAAAANGSAGAGADPATVTTGTVTFTAGRHYVVWTTIFDSTNVSVVNPCTVSSTHGGITFQLAVCPGSDGSVYDRTGGQKRQDCYIGYATSGGTGTITVTPGSGQVAHELGLITAEVTGAYYSSSPLDCLIQAIRLDTTTNATSVSCGLATFTDAVNNAALFFVNNYVSGAYTAGSGATKLTEQTAGTFTEASFWAAGQLLTLAASWTTSSSNTLIGFEIRATGTATPNVLHSCHTVAANRNASGSSLTCSVPFRANKPMFMAVQGQRTDDPRSPSTVASTSFTFTRIVAKVDYLTIASPDRRLEWWYVVPGSTATETVTITYPVSQNAGISAVFVEAPNASTSAPSVANTATDSEDTGSTNQTLDPVLSALTSGNAVLMAHSASGAIGVPTPGSGERLLAWEAGLSGNNGAFWAVTGDYIGVVLGFDTTPSISLHNGTTRSIGAVAIEIAHA